MDGIAIAGLAIAVFDQLWKLAERTAELVSDYRDFDKDAMELESKIKHENSRTRTLRRLLFDKARVYEERTLFEQFDEDIQAQIQISLGKLVSVIDEAFVLLNRHQGISHTDTTHLVPTAFSSGPHPSASTLSMTSSTSTLVNSNPSDTEKKRPSRILRWKWSFHDKKRVEAIVSHFSDLNGRIQEDIKLWCLGTHIGVNPGHLRRLQDDDNSKRLGFDLDAKLQLAVSDVEVIGGTLERQDRTLRQCFPRQQSTDSGYSIFDWEGDHVLLEYRPYAPDAPGPIDIDSRTRERVERLAKLLYQPKEQLFRMPACKGWTLDVTSRQVAFLFAVPPGVDAVPFSLLQVLKTPEQKPSLGEKFRLAHELARCISQLQMVKWVHESFRSENILLFPRPNEENTAAIKPTLRIEFTQPWVLGFEFSRPEYGFSSGPRGVDLSPSRDVYRHPHRLQIPVRPFKKLYDIYALGVVLLEIGLWKPATTLERHEFSRVRDPALFQGHLISQAEKYLGSVVGRKYKDIVVKCLQGSFGVEADTPEDLKLQQAFRSQVVDVLEKAAEHV